VIEKAWEGSMAAQLVRPEVPRISSAQMSRSFTRCKPENGARRRSSYFERAMELTGEPKDKLQS
jgi:hypothetical protein